MINKVYVQYMMASNTDIQSCLCRCDNLQHIIYSSVQYKLPVSVYSTLMGTTCLKAARISQGNAMMCNRLGGGESKFPANEMIKLKCQMQLITLFRHVQSSCVQHTSNNIKGRFNPVVGLRH